MSKQIIPQSGSVLTDIVDISNANFDELYPNVPRTSHLGLSSGNTATQNMDALRAAVSGYTEIYVDGLYDMAGAEIELTNDLRLTGPVNKTCGFVLSSSSSLFRPLKNAGSFICENLQLKYPGFSLSTAIIFRMQADEYYETVIFNNCYFEGTLRVVLCSSVDYDPDLNTYGIGHLIVTNNEAFEVYGQIFSCRNLYSKEELCANNNIRNLGGVFYSSGLDNGTAERQKINDVRKNIIIRDNIVRNDDDFWPTLPTNYIYMCLALTESLNVIYTGNHVEGLKCTPDYAIYDAYLSSTYVIYDNNTWLNNVKFHPSSTSTNTLMKSKSSESAVYTQPLRQYTNSTFRIEDAWLDRIGKTISDCWTTTYEWTENSDIILKNNVIDVKGVSLSNYFEYNSFDISNNEFTYDYFKSGSGGFFYLGSNTTNDGYDSYFNNNTFILKNNPLSLNNPLLGSNWTSGWRNLTINGNTVYCPNTCVDSLFAGLTVEKLNMSDNTFNTQHERVFGYTKIDRLVGGNNIFNTTTTFSGSTWGAGSSTDSSAFVMEEADFEMTSFNDVPFSMVVNKTIALSGESSFKVTLSYLDGNGLDSFSFRYRLYDLSGVTRINFIKEDGTVHDEIVNDNGADNYVYLERLSGFDNGTRIYFNADSPKSKFYSNSEPTTMFLKTFKIEAVKGSGSTVELKNAIKPQAYTFTTLPTLTNLGDIYLITDGSTVSYRATASGGGSENVLVMWDGTNWIYK